MAGSPGVHGQGQAVFGLGRDPRNVANPDTSVADNDLDSILAASSSEVDAHIADTSAAHAASAVSVSSATLVGVGTDVQAVFEEIDDAVALEILYRPLFSYLTADSADVNASEVLVDSGLTVTLGVGTYIWDAVLNVTTADAADIELRVTGTATITAATSFTQLCSPSAATIGNPQFAAWDTATTFVTGANAAGAYVLSGVVVVTVAGTLKIQFTQGTSDATNTHIDSGSRLVAQRVA